MFLGGLAAVLVVLLVAMRRWNQLNANDLGSMSRQWLAEYNARHP
jgi:hypothetical protein